MRPLFIILLLCAVAATPAFAQQSAAPRIFIDLQAKAAKSLNDVLNDGAYAGDNLAELPQGRLRLDDGIEFQVGPKCVVLSGKFVPDRPAEIDGFKVGAKIAQLQFLHGCGWGAFGGKSNPLGHYQEDGTLIGHYRVNYEDGDWGIIPIVYGRDVRDWWAVWDNCKPTTRSKIAWRGTNDHIRQRPEMQGIDDPLRLFLTVWRNPRPDVATTSIDMISEKQVAAPFCIAVTALRLGAKAAHETESSRALVIELQRENAALKRQLDQLRKSAPPALKK